VLTSASGRVGDRASPISRGLRLVAWKRERRGEASGGVCLDPFLAARVDSGGSGITRLFREFVNLLLPRITPRTIGGDLRQAAGLMGRSRVRGAIFLAAASVLAAGEAPQSTACDEDYKSTVCPEVCTSTLAEQCAASV
jgi:hypothetical protein